MRSIVIAAALLFTPALALAKDASATIKIEDWNCKGCAKKTAKALKQIDGVKTVDADYDKSQVVVAYDDSKTNEAAIKAAIKKLKFNCDD